MAENDNSNFYVKLSIFVLFFGLFLLILILTCLSITNTYSNKTWPPTTYKCPDYWDYDDKTNSENPACINSKNIGTCDNVKYTVNDPLTGQAREVNGYLINNMYYTVDNEQVAFDNEKKGMCAKQNWAKSCSLTWDGITNKTFSNCS